MFQFRPNLRQSPPAVFYLRHEVADLSDRGHVDVHTRYPVADFSAELLARDEGEEQHLVAYHKVSLTAECRGEAHHRFLHLCGVRAVREQQTADL